MSDPAPDTSAPSQKRPKPKFTLPNGLTVREARFVDEYLIDCNATQAAKRAKYSERSAYCIGSELLHKSEIAAAIAARMTERSTRTKVDTDWVVQQLRDLLADALANGERAVAKSCLEQLGKHTGGFKTELELSGSLSLNVEGARDRIRDKLARRDAAKAVIAP